MKTESTCRICSAHLGEAIFESSGGNSLTSLCEIRSDPTIVYFCNRCAHTQTRPLPSLHDFYNSSYAILAASEDEDQLYAAHGGGNVFRTDHQLAVLLRHTFLPKGARVLDHGCAKGAVLRKLAASRGDLDLHAFDVTERYVPFWSSFLKPDRWASHHLPDSWKHSFDLVTSFFVLEHAEHPVEFLSTLAGLLSPQGVLHLVVPNVFANPADLIVADHINHFSRSSLAEAVHRAGLHVRHLSDTDHQSAWVLQATKSATAADRDPLPHTSDNARYIQNQARYWGDFTNKVRAFEADRPACRSVIYGSGFYGSLVHASLSFPDQVIAFLDKNPWRQKQHIFEKPILSPDRLPQDVKCIYLGINPAHAATVVEEWRGCWGEGMEVFLP